MVVGGIEVIAKWWMSLAAQGYKIKEERQGRQPNAVWRRIVARGQVAEKVKSRQKRQKSERMEGVEGVERQKDKDGEGEG